MSDEMISRSKLNCSQWFRTIRAAHEHDYFVLYKDSLRNPNEGKWFPEGSQEVTYWGNDNPMWVLFEPEMLTMVKLRGSDDILVTKPFDFMWRLCVHMHNWPFDVPPTSVFPPDWNLRNLGLTINTNPESAPCLDGKNAQEVRERFEIFNQRY